MLSSLSISNVAVIKQIDAELSGGLSVLSGETGAGKSIIIDSINMVLGERSKTSLVRYGETKARVSAVFDVSENTVNELAEHGIDVEDGQVFITREVNSEGKSTCRINGVPSPIGQLKSIAPLLVNIHGQHDNQALLDPKKHIRFVDLFGDTASELEAYKVVYQKRAALSEELESLTQDEAERIRMIDLLEYQVNEIDEASLSIGEDDELEEQQRIASNAEAIKKATLGAYNSLFGAEFGSAYDSISSAISELEGVADCMDEIAKVLEGLRDSFYAIEDSAHEISAIADNIDYDEQTLNDIEERLALIQRLKRKYGATIEEILAFGDGAREDLSAMQGADERIEDIKQELDKCEKELAKCAGALSKKRKSAGAMLETQIKEALSDLDMGKADFKVNITELDGFGANGQDCVEFLISTNAGEPPKSLSFVASGGELSRVMLALKSVLADADGVDTMIFDEIDTGVSGIAAQKIAKKLALLSKKRQVICISHLPQITSMADNHFLIEKKVIDDKTETNIRELSDEERICEIARLTDGEPTQASLTHARELLERARQGKC